MSSVEDFGVHAKGVKRKSQFDARTSTKLSTKDNLRIRWIERTTSSHLPCANFIFEITFPDVEAMKFEAVCRSINYSEDSDDFMECYSVGRVMPFFSNVLYTGDILLRVNGQSLLRKSVNGEFIDPQKSSSCLENIAAAAAASGGVTIRFMRTGSTSLNFTPSPAELNLFQVDKHIAAKFSVLRVKPTGLQQSTSQQWSIQLSFLDQQLPSSIAQMMMGGAVTWGHTLLLPHSGPAAVAQCTQIGLLAPSSAAAASSHGVAGPGAFLGPNNVPASLADSWLPPSASLYADPPPGPLSGQTSSRTPALSQEETVAHLVSALINQSAAGAEVQVKSLAAESTSAGSDASDGEGDEEEDAVGEVLSVEGGVFLLDATTFTAAGAAFSVGGSGLPVTFSGLGGTSSLAAASQQFTGSVAPVGSAKTAAKWEAVLRVTLAGQDGAVGARTLTLGLGRFEKETDAKLACEQGVAEVRSIKSFRPRRFAKRLATALSAAATVTAAPAQAPSQSRPGAPALPAAGPGKPVYPYGTQSAQLHHQQQQQRYAATGPSGGLGAGAGMLRPGAGGSASTGSMAGAALANKVVSSGEQACGFGDVAKVIVNLAPSGHGASLHASSSSGNIAGTLHQPPSAQNPAMARAK